MTRRPTGRLLLAHVGQVCYTARNACKLKSRSTPCGCRRGICRMATETEDNYRSNGDGGGAPSGLRRARLALAISDGKLAGASGRFFRIGGGTSLAGMIARRIDPNVLNSVVGARRARKIVITGSNGKTTTARMTATIADFTGQRVSHNRTGSNMLQGVTSVAVNFADMFGQLASDVLLFGIIEGAVPMAGPEIHPHGVRIPNISLA